MPDRALGIDQTDSASAWSWGKVLLAVAWLIVTVLVATILFLISAYASGGNPSNPVGRAAARSALAPQLGAGLIAAAGPLGVWLLRRSRFWLWLGLGLLILALLNGLRVYVRAV